MKISTIILVSLSLSCLLYACSENKKTIPVNPDSTIDSVDAECETETIKDPNNPKPMALMMRQLAANADSMKQQIIRGEQLDSTRYPFIKFYLVEPTDPNVLEPQFYENARLFQEAYIALFKHPKEQVKYHNLVIQKCISGPLKRIRKLLIQ
jgi:hypothetical protein